MRQGGNSPVSGLAGIALLKAGEFAEAEALFGFACRSLPLYSSARRQYAYLMYKARMQRIGDLSEADRHGIQQEIDRGKVLIEHGSNPSGRAAFFVGKLYGLLGDKEREREYIGLANEARGEHDG